VLRFFIMSRHSTFTFAEVYKELYPVGESGYGAVLKTMTSNPAFYLRSLLTWEKVRYVLQLFAPLAFLPLRRPWLLVFFVPGLVLTLSTTAYAPTIAISFQYICNWAGYAFVAAIVVLSLYGSDAVGTQKRLAAAVALSLGILLSNQQWGAWTPSPVVRGGFVDVAFLPPTKADLDRDDDLQALMKLVPGDAKLCSADRTQPHVSWHIHNWSLKDGLYQCEYLIFTDVPGDLGSDRGAQQIATGAFTVVKSQRGVTLAKKAAAPPPAR